MDQTTKPRLQKEYAALRIRALYTGRKASQLMHARFRRQLQQDRQIWHKVDQPLRVQQDDGFRFPDLPRNVPKDMTSGSTDENDFSRFYNLKAIQSCRTTPQPILTLSLSSRPSSLSLHCKGQRYLSHHMLQRQSWLSVTVLNRSSHHANILWINHKQKEIEFFEPQLSIKLSRRFRARANLISAFLARRRCLRHYRWILSTYPKYGEQSQIGPQALTQDDNCGIWCVLFIHLKSLNRQLASSEDMWFHFFNRFISRFGHNWKRQLRLWAAPIQILDGCITIDINHRHSFFDKIAI